MFLYKHICVVFVHMQIVGGPRYLDVIYIYDLNIYGCPRNAYSVAGTS